MHELGIFGAANTWINSGFLGKGQKLIGHIMSGGQRSIVMKHNRFICMAAA